MEIKKKIEIDAFSIHNAPNLDYIDVYIRMDSTQAGRITIQCWDQCWTAYWGAMGGGMQQFFIAAPEGYLVNAMQSKIISNKRKKVHEDAYLFRIVQAVKVAMRERMKDGYLC